MLLAAKLTEFVPLKTSSKYLLFFFGFPISETIYKQYRTRIR